MNTHYAVTIGDSNDMTLIATGPKEFCEQQLAAWVARHGLSDYGSAEILTRDLELLPTEGETWVNTDGAVLTVNADGTGSTRGPRPGVTGHVTTENMAIVRDSPFWRRLGT